MVLHHLFGLGFMAGLHTSFCWYLWSCLGLVWGYLVCFGMVCTLWGHQLLVFGMVLGLIDQVWGMLWFVYWYLVWFGVGFGVVLELF